MTTVRRSLFPFFVALFIAVSWMEPSARAAASCTGQCCNLNARPDCICQCNDLQCGSPFNNVDICGHTYNASVSCGTCPSGTACEDLTSVGGPSGACVTYDPCATAALTGECGTFTDPVLHQQVTCNTCTGGTVCGGDPNAPNRCAATCASAGASCGSVPDGVGGTLNCGGCPGGEECTSAFKCCAPTFTCSAHGLNCGTFGDGCGGSVNCGSCPAGQPCSGGRCCTPATCAQLNAKGECGKVSDGCGGTLQCPTPTGMACSGTALVACTHGSCNGATCGTFPDGNCQGETITCGTCAAGLICAGTTCVNPAPALPPSGNAVLAGFLGVVGMAAAGWKRRKRSV